MRSKKKALIVLGIILFILIMARCNQGTESNGVIDLISVSESAQRLNLEEVIEIEDITFLETKEESLITFVLKTIFCDDAFYIRSNSGVYKFLATGEYINTIGKIGRGPGEYTGIIDFTVNGDLNLVMILTAHPQAVYMYDTTGEFKGSFKIERAASSIEAHGDIIMVTFEDINPVEEYIIGLYNLEGRIVAQKPNQNRFRYKEAYQVTHMLHGTRTKMSQGILFKEFHNDTIFLVSRNSWEPHVILNPGKLRYTTDMRAENKDPSESITISRLMWSDDLILVRFIVPLIGRQLLVINDKRGTVKSIDIDNSIGNEFYRLLLTGMRPIGGGRYYTLINAQNMLRFTSEIEFLTEPLTSVLNENSNPAVITFRLSL